MEGFSGLLPLIPKWLAVPIVVVGFLIAAFPKISPNLGELSSWGRFYSREKRRLELLKLRYEIETIKKTNELTELSDDAFYPPVHRAAKQEASGAAPLTFSKRFWFGSLGVIVPIFLNLIFRDLSTTFSNVTPLILLGYTIRIIVLICMAGFVSAFALKKQATRFTCFLVGLSVTLAITYVMSVISTIETPVNYGSRPTE